ncbi:hypothetical protein Ppro_0948 [Pelobacter propionicus DSM 2379]|uniref:Uncharacterized protein n=1 Tax=Pelobacter propionicus (strain DSM 2379 / NBRC 103807 / OttBd1) TaxID=338966 RepID=A1AMK7_PELPD|nr:hypothetical protein Ppro_0948 [Pelobacter propionicus DSM 2379]
MTPVLGEVSAEQGGYRPTSCRSRSRNVGSRISTAENRNHIILFVQPHKDEIIQHFGVHSIGLFGRYAHGYCAKRLCMIPGMCDSTPPG